MTIRVKELSLGCKYINRTIQKYVTFAMKTDLIKSGRTGRPCGFYRNEALEAAMRVFWEQGYEGATLTELTAAMSINRSSMYAAFGDKESLFKLSVGRYVEGPGSYMREALKQPTLRAVVEACSEGQLSFWVRLAIREDA